MLKCTTCQVPSNKSQECFILYFSTDQPHQFIVIDPVEKRLKVKVYNPVVALINVLVGLLECVVRTPFGSKTVTKIGEVRFPNFTEYPVDSLLNQPVNYRRNTKCSGTACLLYTSPSPRDLSTSRMPSSA